MEFIFQNPIWWIAGLAGVPLLAHLFSKVRPRRFEFPSLRLLREAARKVARVERPRDRWLLLLRTLAVAALVAAFLQPVLRTAAPAAAAGRRNAAILIDASASMGVADGPLTRFAQAKRKAEEIIGGLPPGSHANVIWIRNPSQSVLPEPGVNLEFLREQIRAGQLSFERGDAAGAFDLALRQLEESPGRREIVVLSDFQASAWSDVAWPSSQGVEVKRVGVAATDVENVCVSSLEVQPPQPVAGHPARIEAKVRNHGANARRLTLYIEAGEQRGSREVEVPPWGEGLAVMPVVFPRKALAVVKASIAEDKFPADDARHTVADVRETFRAGILAPATDATAAAWRRALSVLPFLRVADVNPGSGAGAAPGAFDVIFASGWAGEGAEELAAAVAGGCALVLMPAESCTIAQLRILIPSLPAEAALLRETRSEGWPVVMGSEDHPVFKLFAGGDAGDPSSGRFYSRTSISGSLHPAAALLNFDDGRPAVSLWESNMSAAGRVVLWQASLDKSTWPGQGVYVAFLGELTRHLTSSSWRTLAGKPRALEAGALLSIEPTAGFSPGEIELVDDRGGKPALSARATGGMLATKSAPAPGAYAWVAQGAVIERSAVQFPTAESDLRILSEPMLATKAAGSGRLDLTQPGLQEGRNLWPWCLALAALFLALEGAMAWGFSRREKSGTRRAYA